MLNDLMANDLMANDFFHLHSETTKQNKYGT